MLVVFRATKLSVSGSLFSRHEMTTFNQKILSKLVFFKQIKTLFYSPMEGVTRNQELFFADEGSLNS